MNDTKLLGAKWRILQPLTKMLFFFLTYPCHILRGTDSARFESFRKFPHNLSNAGILWVTPLCQPGCKDPRYARVVGLRRMIRSEMLVDFATCEIDSFSPTAAKIVQVLAKFQRRESDDVLKPDFEYAIHDGIIQVERLYPFALKCEFLISEPDDKAILDVGMPGRLNTPHWIRTPREDSRNNEVKVEVHSAGLNFRVRNSRSCGIYAGNWSSRTFSSA
ncbi:hypothetical protein F5Y13DRAFT_103691 [Hypoxylon sp. FL1857]|nr:hypothetical protein F5Y13DRAFT_103691 [Hypoxylon sp. FL1857]